MSVLETYTGAYLNYAAPDASQIDLRDIARSLSQMCRFNGHTSKPYSVAEHALLVHHFEPQLGLAALHHDSHEAYLGDIPTPLKQHLTGWKGLTQRIDRAIGDAFGIPLAAFTHPDVKAADRLALRVEAYELKRSKGLGLYWGNAGAPPVSAPWPLGMPPKAAERQFLATHNRLMRNS
jgi:hypothetical protein